MDWPAQFEALQAFRPPVDVREAQSWAELRAFRDDSNRDETTHHVTAAGIVVSERGVVLLEHKRLGIWVQPGGHIDEGERPEQAALRESREETGLAIRFPRDQVRLIHIDAHDGGRGHRHYDFRYLLQGLGSDPTPPAGESQQVRWCSLREVLDLADPGLAGLFHAVRVDPEPSLFTRLAALAVVL